MSTTNRQHNLTDQCSIPSTTNEHFKTVLEKLLPLGAQQDASAYDYFKAYQSLSLIPKQDQPKQLYGVIIELGQEGGYDLLATYANCFANFTNAQQPVSKVWERPDANFDALIADVLEAGLLMLPNMPQWDADFEQPVACGWMRIHLVSSQGIYSGEAPLEEMARSPYGEEMTAATQMLMNWLAVTDLKEHEPVSR
jgi:hypothetical protein